MEIIFFLLMFAIAITVKNISKQNKRKHTRYKKANNKINTNWDNMSKKSSSNKATTQSVTDIAIYFNISSRKLNTILENLGWQEVSGRWKVATAEGIKRGVEEKYNVKNKQKYLMWDVQIKYNQELLDEVKKIKENKTVKPSHKNMYETIKETETKAKKMSKKEKKEKGDLYEAYISKYFKDLGYTIAEHGKDNGVKDNGIDIIAKKGKEIFFIQCKNWSLSSSNRIKDKDLKSTQTDARDYLKKNALYVNLGYKMKILYICSEDVFHASARYYAEENNDIYSLEVIAIKN